VPHIPTGYGQINFRFGGLAIPFGAECTLGFANISEHTASEAASIVAGECTAVAEATMVESASIDEVLVKLGPTSTGDAATIAVGVIGDQGIDATQQQVAINVVKNTAQGGRKGRGRMFWPGAPESVIDVQGQFSSGSILQFESAFNLMRTNLATSGMILSLLHSSPADTPLDLTAFTVKARSITQRRRNRPR
jgi:hypothetical protein